MTGEKLSLTQVAIKDIDNWSVCITDRKGGYGVKDLERGNLF